MVFIKLPSSLSSSSPHSSSLALRTPSARTASPEYPFYQKNWFIGLLFLMAHGFFCLALLIFLTVDSDSGYTSASAAASGKEGVESVFRLHSSDVPYGSGSGQQSVTGFPVVLDSNSYWDYSFRRLLNMCLEQQQSKVMP